ncbi:alpha-1/alpha-2 family phenol-soluble modulin [Staphylococcus aureus]
MGIIAGIIKLIKGLIETLW